MKSFNVFTNTSIWSSVLKACRQILKPSFPSGTVGEKIGLTAIFKRWSFSEIAFVFSMLPILIDWIGEITSDANTSG